MLHRIVKIEMEIKIEMHIVFSLKTQLILFIKESSGKKENGKGRQKKKRKQKVQKKKKQDGRSEGKKFFFLAKITRS